MITFKRSNATFTKLNQKNIFGCYLYIITSRMLPGPLLRNIHYLTKRNHTFIPQENITNNSKINSFFPKEGFTTKDDFQRVLIHHNGNKHSKVLECTPINRNAKKSQGVIFNTKGYGKSNHFGLAFVLEEILHKIIILLKSEQQTLKGRKSKKTHQYTEVLKKPTHDNQHKNLIKIGTKELQYVNVFHLALVLEEILHKVICLLKSQHNCGNLFIFLSWYVFKPVKG